MDKEFEATLLEDDEYVSKKLTDYYPRAVEISRDYWEVR